MNFNFNKSRVKCAKLGFKVHGCKALIGMKETEGRAPKELDVLSKAVDYIKALEAEVIRLESTPTVTNISNHIDANDIFSRGLLGRFFGGPNQ